MMDLCASLQHTIVEILMDKLEKAVKQTVVASYSKKETMEETKVISK